MLVTKFTFNGFGENTFVLHDETKEAVIVDPGCYEREEEEALKNFIQNEGLKPVMLLNTHFHLDHIFGNRFVHETYGLLPLGHEKDMLNFNLAERSAEMYGFRDFKMSPAPERFISEKDELTFGNTTLEIRFTPGHAPGHIVFVHHPSKSVINGDVLFHGSIGRTDLPGGDADTLFNSIRTALYTLPDDYVVYCGHGPETTIGREKASNPFVRL